MSGAASGTAPRPPEGDWLGTPYLRFERRPPFAHLTVDRPEARNALTQAMYFGIRYAVRRVDADPELAGLLITGTGDVFIPGGARDLMFTGRRLTAAEALEWGLVSRVVPHDELIKTAAEALVQIVQTAPEARRDIKRVLDQYVGLQDRIAFFDSLQRAESREGFAAFIERL